MDDVITLISKAFILGGPTSIIALLIGFIFYLLLQIRSLNKKIEEKDKELKELLVKSNETNEKMATALTDLKVVMAEIKGSIQ